MCCDLDFLKNLSRDLPEYSSFRKVLREIVPFFLEMGLSISPIT